MIVIAWSANTCHYSRKETKRKFWIFLEAETKTCASVHPSEHKLIELLSGLSLKIPTDGEKFPTSQPGPLMAKATLAEIYPYLDVHAKKKTLFFLPALCAIFFVAYGKKILANISLQKCGCKHRSAIVEPRTVKLQLWICWPIEKKMPIFWEKNTDLINH